MDLCSLQTKETAQGNLWKFEIREDAGDVLVCRVSPHSGCLPGKCHFFFFFFTCVTRLQYARMFKCGIVAVRNDSSVVAVFDAFHFITMVSGSSNNNYHKNNNKTFMPLFL